MKKLIAFAVTLLASASMYAQSEVGSFSIVPQVGINFASMTNETTMAKTGFVVGAEGKYQASEKWAISAGLFYANEGAKTPTDASWNINNLNIPVLANYYVMPGLAVKLGVQPALNLSSKCEGDDMKDVTKSFGVSIPVGVSYEIADVIFDVRYHIGLNDKIKSADGAKDNTFQITVGYRINL